MSLRGAATALTRDRSRGRFGNALQWHFGLESHDGEAKLDWEDRIEIKLVTVWARRDGRLVCDKLKVCDLGVDPWHKLSNVLWVFVDRVSRVVIGHRFFRLAGPARERLARSWGADPHFQRPDLFVEARQSGDQIAPAYYLAASWFRREGLFDGIEPLFGFDGAWWAAARRRARGREPAIALSWQGAERARCGHCGGRIRRSPEYQGFVGFFPGLHELPLAPSCAARGHVILEGERLPRCHVSSVEEQLRDIQGLTPPEQLWRLTDRVAEPDDHEH
ncbi:MAG: hypothetical protein B7733_23700 [Myxococcales bacterium FL481]|nr:MAG: hypothetical protein B7733_23700 [Myxococcales bacterium FL481]